MLELQRYYFKVIFKINLSTGYKHFMDEFVMSITRFTNST